MNPGRYDLDGLYRGDTYGWRFILWQDAGRTIPVNLAGAVVKAQVRNETGGGLVTDMTCVVTVPNIIDATLTPAESAQLPLNGVWDLEVTYPGGMVSTVLYGYVAAIADVTAVVGDGRWPVTA